MTTSWVLITNSYNTWAVLIFCFHLLISGSRFDMTLLNSEEV